MVVGNGEDSVTNNPRAIHVSREKRAAKNMVDHMDLGGVISEIHIPLFRNQGYSNIPWRAGPGGYAVLLKARDTLEVVPPGLTTRER